ncbi:MAG: ferrous iron transport protein A [Arcobacteraceae bacterium]|nr:ferrous iron transport protein A [Arcobacteraceae bacterium]
MKLKQDGSGKGKQLNQRLDGMGKGQKYKIAKLHTKGKLMHKLLDMGFVEGTEIEIVREAPFYDPMELKIHNYNVSLRKSEASLIEVEK